MLETTQVTAGSIPEYEAPEKDGYEFIGWDPEPVEAAEDAEYTAIYEAIQYNITLTKFNGNNALQSEPDTAVLGETVTITAPGYDIVSITVTNDTNGSTVNVTGVDDETYTFEMPASDVTVEAELVAQEFTATATNPENEPEGYDTIVVLLEDGDPNNSTSSTTVATGDTVTVRVSWANQASMLDSVTMTWDGGTETKEVSGYSVDGDRGISTFEFKMPPGDAVFTAALSPVYEIYITDNLTNIATVSVNYREYNPDMPFTSKAGEEVTLVITPDGGGAIAAGVMPTVTVHDGNNVYEINVSGDGGNYSFNMPTEFNSTAGYVSVSMDAYAVRVYVESDGGITNTITVSANGTSLTLTAENGEEALLVSPGTRVEVRAVSAGGYVRDAEADVTLDETVNAGDGDNNTDVTYAFDMPEGNVDISIHVGGA